MNSEDPPSDKREPVSSDAQRDLVRDTVQRLQNSATYRTFSDHPRLGKPIVHNVTRVGMAIVSATMKRLASYAIGSPLGEASTAIAAAARATGRPAFATRFDAAQRAVETLG